MVTINGINIVTHSDIWPFPTWSAVTDNYEGGDGYSERPSESPGTGETEHEAIAELLRNLSDDCDTEEEAERYDVALAMHMGSAA